MKKRRWDTIGDETQILVILLAFLCAPIGLYLFFYYLTKVEVDE